MIVNLELYVHVCNAVTLGVCTEYFWEGKDPTAAWQSAAQSDSSIGQLPGQIQSCASMMR